MDLLRDYGSESSSEDENKLTDVQVVSSWHGTTSKGAEIVPLKKANSGTFIRSVSHVPGNWAGHIFCETPCCEEWQQEMADSVLRFQQYLHGIGFQGKELFSHTDGQIHLSLSRPFSLQLSMIESFIKQLRSRVTHLPGSTARVRPSSEEILINDDKTRSFWSWPVEANDTLLALVEEIDTVLNMYDQPPYYDPPKFHISVASVFGNISTSLTDASSQSTSCKGVPFYLPIHTICCTFGTTKEYKINLL